MDNIFILSDDGKTITGIRNRSVTRITIPDSVTAIGSWALSGCTSLQSIDIPNSVTSIDSWAFRGCTSLKSIDIPNSVTSIGVNAFEGCTSLKSIDIPNSVTSIGHGAFRGCTSLQSIDIPNSVTSIGDSAFEGTKWFDSQPDGIIYIGNVLYKYKGTLKEKSLFIRKGTISISPRAFEGCTSLQSIDIPNSVTTIGGNAFEGCTSLQSIDIPNSVTSIGESAFKGCTSLQSIDIPYSVTNIGGFAFYHCTSLQSIDIPNSVTNIGGFAFSGCTSLQNIDIPNSVTSIGGGALEGTKWFDSQPDGIIYIGNVLYKYKGTLKEKSVSIRKGTISISPRAFEGCTSLQSIDIPNSVTTIGGNAFEGCTSLQSIDIPNSVTSIGAYAFDGCTSLQSIDIPNSVTSIGAYAFGGCTSLQSIDIPNSMTSIGAYAFSGCTSIKKVTLPSTLDCSGLGFEIDNMVADSIIYSDIPDNSPIIKGGNQEVNYSYSNISRFNTIDVKLDFRNCDKQYICFGKEKYLLNKLQEIVGPRKGAFQSVDRSFIVGLLHKENLEISILVSPMRKFVFKIDNSPNFEWQGFDILGTLKEKKQFWMNLLIEGFVKENQDNNRCYSQFEKDEIIDFSLNNVSIGFDPNRLQRWWIDSRKWRACGRFIFIELSNNNELSTNKDKRKRLLHIMTFHRSGVLVDEENPKYPLVTDRIVDNYSSEVGQFFEKCPSVLVFVAALIGHKLRCIETKRYRIAGYDPNSKNGVDYDGRNSHMASFSKFEFIGPKPTIREEWLSNDGDRKAAEYIIDNLGTQSLKYYSLSNIISV